MAAQQPLPEAAPELRQSLLTITILSCHDMPPKSGETLKPIVHAYQGNHTSSPAGLGSYNVEREGTTVFWEESEPGVFPGKLNPSWTYYSYFPSYMTLFVKHNSSPPIDWCRRVIDPRVAGTFTMEPLKQCSTGNDYGYITYMVDITPLVNVPEEKKPAAGYCSVL